MKELDMRGMPAVMEEALARAGNGASGFHCTFDMDVVDPRFAPGVGTPVMGGITYRESHLAMEMVYDSGRLLSLDVVEVNPVLDEENSTGLLAVELICSALGKKIL
jgi:arginase